MNGVSPDLVLLTQCVTERWSDLLTQSIPYSKRKVLPSLPSCLTGLSLFFLLHMGNGFKWAAVVLRRNPRNVKPQRGNVSLCRS